MRLGGAVPGGALVPRPHSCDVRGAARPRLVGQEGRSSGRAPRPCGITRQRGWSICLTCLAYLSSARRASRVKLPTTRSIGAAGAACSPSSPRSSKPSLGAYRAARQGAGRPVRSVLRRGQPNPTNSLTRIWTEPELASRLVAKTLFKPISFELSQLLGDIDLGKLALPELQRPFVWQKSEVRDLLDSMYQGFPVGYLMLWNAAEVDSKFIGVDGKQLTPTEFIVDGQQRLTSLYAVMKGAEVTFKDFTTGRINLAFRPRDGRFEVTDAAIEKDPEFLADITRLWTGADFEVIEEFVERLRQGRPEALENGGGEGGQRRALPPERAVGLSVPGRADRPRGRRGARCRDLLAGE
jgi:hypothetical protein